MKGIKFEPKSKIGIVPLWGWREIKRELWIVSVIAAAVMILLSAMFVIPSGPSEWAPSYDYTQYVIFLEYINHIAILHVIVAMWLYSVAEWLIRPAKGPFIPVIYKALTVTWTIHYIMGCIVLRVHIHTCYLVNFCLGWKVPIMGCVPIFHHCVNWKVHAIVHAY